MAVTSQVESLNKTFFCWKLLGIWPEGKSVKLYKFYSYIYIFSTLILYDMALTVNLFYTPGKIELLIQEVTFFFNVIAITIKVLMTIVWRKKIVEVLKILDDEMFQGKDNATQDILNKAINTYKMYWIVIVGLGNFAFAFKSIIPVIANLIMHSYQIKLPTSNYYFLDEQTKTDYFVFLFAYQSFSIYGLMMYDVTIDAFINGCIFFAITQIKVLNYKLTNLTLDRELKLSRYYKDQMQIRNLNVCLRHYDYILKYCSDIQSIIKITLFVQYSMGSMVICVLFCALLLPLTTEEYTFMVAYLLGMVLQIFVPSWLGTQISHESQELVFAAYNSDWIPRTEPFKRSVKVFMERANTPIEMVGLKLFPLSLETFISIMKTAYSFMTLVRNFQDRERTTS